LRIAITIAFLLLVSVVRVSPAQYQSTELCVIEWGDNSNQLKIAEPIYEDENETPADSSDDWIEKAGPDEGFVDRNENIYFSSGDFSQFKAFGKDGHLIFDYSSDKNNLFDSLFQINEVGNCYVDSLSHIYLIYSGILDYIPIIDTTGKLLNIISPQGVGSGKKIGRPDFNSDDIIGIYCPVGGFYTYTKGAFREGGSTGWLAKDGYYYAAGMQDSSTLWFKKYSDPDGSGNPKWEDMQYRHINWIIDGAGGNPTVDDSLYLYVVMGLKSIERRCVMQVYNLKYELVGEIYPEPEVNRYLWHMGFYVRPDGTVYEFRCLDDGLHVIKWSKK
jgi:hypothetical protein